MDPRPEINERIFWGIEREGVKPMPMPKSYPSLRYWSWKLYWLGFAGYGLYNIWKTAPRDALGDIIWTELLSSLFTSFAELFFLFIAVVGVIFLVRTSSKFTSVTEKAMPLWLSARRLTYVPAEKRFGTILPLEQIQSAKLDYANGALAVRLKTATDTIHLLTSDAKNLLQHLYTLRPELEPSS